MNETSKASIRRAKDLMYESQYFVGSGLDIGGGNDCLSLQVSRFPKMDFVRNWDLKDGDAQYLTGVDDESFDFVYSSHCLEHMRNPEIALSNWIRVLKSGGYLVVSVPDEDLYEHGIWPSCYNLDHKWSFTLYKAFSEMPKSINVVELIKSFALEVECHRIARIEDGYVEGLGITDQTLGHAECAIEFVLKKKSPTIEALMLIADRLERVGDLEGAHAAYSMVLEQAPLFFDAYNRFANVLVRQGLIGEAMILWDKCVKNLPQLHIAQMYRALFLISIGMYDEGFRLRDPLVSGERRTPIKTPSLYPMWNGESLKNKSIVIWTEFGYGDEIMFARFAEVMKVYYGAQKVSLVCQSALVSLFKTLPFCDLVLSGGDAQALPMHDYWVFPHSIPVYFSLQKNGVPNKAPYFDVSQNEVTQTKQLLPSRTAGRIRVGLVTRGNPTHENDQLRSIDNLCEFQELFELPGIDWIDLQKGLPLGGFEAQHLPENFSIIHLGEYLSDFEKTAALCSQLDLLISVDTSIAHLAGALNIPVWLMLPTYSDWRWGIQGSTSDWYLSVQIFRQTRLANWSDVIRDIRLALCEKLRAVSCI